MGLKVSERSFKIKIEECVSSYAPYLGEFFKGPFLNQFFSLSTYRYRYICHVSSCFHLNVDILVVPHQQVEKLLNRVEAARVDTKDALQRISGNTDHLRDSLNSLNGRNITNTLVFSKVCTQHHWSSSTGFNHQIKNYKNEADVAIQRLNGINSTIQQAVSSNDETQAVLRDMSVDYDQTLGTINLLESLVNSIEVTPHLPSSASSSHTFTEWFALFFRGHSDLYHLKMIYLKKAQNWRGTARTWRPRWTEWAEKWLSSWMLSGGWRTRACRLTSTAITIHTGVVFMRKPEGDVFVGCCWSCWGLQ